MRILFATAPGYGLMLPVVPLIWAARAAGHEVLVATTSAMTDVGARSGLPVVDVCPERDLWDDLINAVQGNVDGLPPQYRAATGSGSPFGLFTLAMTEGTISAGRAFGAELVVHTSDHAAGALAAVALDLPALEVGNRVSWSLRDVDFRQRMGVDGVVAEMRERLAIGDAAPAVLARIDPRPPSMGGIGADQADETDGVPWWPMRFVPYNGGAVLPQWVLREHSLPRVCVTLGTVVPAMSGVSILAAVLDALSRLDVEVVLAAGEADLSSLGELPSNVNSVGFVPLSAFLTTCSLIVHHGGSGTTAAPLHYGVPQLVLPSFADNPVSAERVVQRGVGLSCDPATADSQTIESAVRRLLDESSFHTAAAEVRAEMAAQPSPSVIIDRVSAALLGCVE